MKHFLSFLALAFAVSSSAYAQTTTVNSDTDPRTTPAYSMLIQRKVKVQAELETLLNQYTSEWPAAKRLRYELDAVESEMNRMAETMALKTVRLTSGYGSLILRKISLTAELQVLFQDYGSDWPETKTRRRELSLLEGELQEIMK